MKFNHYWPYQINFLRWLDDNFSLFPYQPIGLTVTPGYIAFGLKGVTSLLRVKIFDRCVRIEVQYRGHPICELASFSMSPVLGHNEQLYCDHCLLIEGEERLYPDHSSMSREHLYLPLLQWLSDVLPVGLDLEIVQFNTGYIAVRQSPYVYVTPSLHFDEFMSQLEMKYELVNSTSRREIEIMGFYYAPIFSEPTQFERFIDIEVMRPRCRGIVIPF